MDWSTREFRNERRGWAAKRPVAIERIQLESRSLFRVSRGAAGFWVQDASFMPLTSASHCAKVAKPQLVPSPWK